MHCQNINCQNHSDAADKKCTDCFVLEELRLVEEGVSMVQSGEQPESVKRWYYNSMSQKSESDSYRKRYNDANVCTRINRGLVEILQRLGIDVPDNGEVSPEQERVASSFGFFAFPPVTQFWSELTTEERRKQRAQLNL